MSLFDWIGRKKGNDLPETVENAKRGSGRYNDYSKYNSRYEYILFTPFVNASDIVGRENAYYTNEESAQTIYIYKIHKLSKSLIDRSTVHPKLFFSTLNELDYELKNCPYNIKNFKKQAEIEYFESRKEQIVIDFINRSFKDCYESALQLKTVKGRINHVENWFLQMEYYKKQMTDRAKYIIESLYCEWIGEYKAIAEKGN